MNRQAPRHAQARLTPRELLDAYFDGQLPAEELARLRSALDADPLLAEEFARTCEAVSLLRTTARRQALTADLTERVLQRTHRRRRFLTRGDRRAVLAGRTAVALAGLLMAAGLVAWIRLTPVQLRLMPHERPIGTLVEGSGADAMSMRLVPERLREDLAQAVVHGQPEQRIVVYDLRPDPPEAFSPFGKGLAHADGASPHDAGRAGVRPVQPGSGQGWSGQAGGWPSAPVAGDRIGSAWDGPLLVRRAAEAWVASPSWRGWAADQAPARGRSVLVRTPEGRWLLLRLDAADRSPRARPANAAGQADGNAGDHAGDTPGHGPGHDPGHGPGQDPDKE